MRPGWPAVKRFRHFDELAFQVRRCRQARVDAVGQCSVVSVDRTSDDAGVFR
jgi:hypothetical protein